MFWIRKIQFFSNYYIIYLKYWSTSKNKPRLSKSEKFLDENCVLGEKVWILFDQKCYQNNIKIFHWMKNASDAINRLIGILRETTDFSFLSENFVSVFSENEKIDLEKEIYDFATSKKYVSLLTESGIGHNEGFLSELFSKIGKKSFQKSLIMKN